MVQHDSHILTGEFLQGTGSSRSETNVGKGPDTVKHGREGQKNEK